MRPKKVILCVENNEQELSVLRYLLKTNGYRVISAANGQEAIAAFTKEQQIDLVLVNTRMPQMTGRQLVERLKRIASYVPMLLLDDSQPGSSELHAADAMMARRNCTAQELLERIKLMSARKRGPRKGAQRAAQDSQLAAAS